MRTSRLIAQFDFVLILVALALSGLGMLGVYSASVAHGNQLYWGQLLRIGIALTVCVGITFIDYRQLIDRAFVLYLAFLGVLTLVLIFGKEINGSKSWIGIGDFNFQPSELAKIVVILVMVRLLSDNSEDRVSNRQLVILGAVSAVPILLVILQHDLGTAVMFLPAIAGVVFCAGVRKRVFAYALLILVLAAPLIWLGLKDYHRQRVLVTIDPELDPLGIGYQTRQSQIAIGSGGIWGRGIGKGLQSQLGFVPESHNDFIFALLAEETGLVGALAILALYMLLISRLITLGQEARDREGMLLIAGIVAYLFSHVAVNVGMALGIVPPIGIPLPLLSYGGSSILTTFLALGLALNVGLRRYMYL